VKDFRELNVWQKAHQLTLAVYRLTAGRDFNYRCALFAVHQR